VVEGKPTVEHINNLSEKKRIVSKWLWQEKEMTMKSIFNFPGNCSG